MNFIFTTNETKLMAKHMLVVSSICSNFLGMKKENYSPRIALHKTDAPMVDG